MMTPPSFAQAAGGVVGAATLFLLFRYRMAIKRRFTKLQQAPKHPFTMMRIKQDNDGSGPAPPSSALGQHLELLELHEPWRAQHAQGWSIISLGEYLSTLRPAYLPGEDLPSGIQSQIETALAQTLLKVLGPHLGKAVLPAIGVVNKPLEGASKELAQVGKMGAMAMQKTKGSAPLALFAIGATVDTAARGAASGGGASIPQDEQQHQLTPLALMHIGEVGYDPSFGATMMDDVSSNNESTPLLSQDDDKSSKEFLIPNPFIVSKHWTRAIEGMEARIQSQIMSSGGQQEQYDPNSRKLNDPVPLDEAMLPDLYIGWGQAECSHTKREIIRNRLLGSLLNRLGANYAADSDQPFVVYMEQGSKPVSRPADFVQELIRTGHSFVACPSSAITTFGIALCVKQDDESWSNIPLAFFLETGYEDKDGESAVVYMPHSGLSMQVSGPLMKNEKCDLQHYLAIEGMCGWHSNHDPVTPWRKAVECCEPFTGDDAVEAVRIAGLLAVVMNTVGTEMHLPHGGYGLTGVCNDTAALIECAMNGQTNLYPMTSIGRFAADTIRCMKRVHDRLLPDASMTKEVASLLRMMKAMLNLPNDYHALPPLATDASRRMLHTLPAEPPFELMIQARSVMEKMQQEHEEYRFLHRHSGVGASQTKTK